MLSRKGERLRGRRHAGARHYESRVRESLQVVSADVDIDRQRSQLLGAALRYRATSRHPTRKLVAVFRKQQRRGAAAAGETDDGDLALARHELARGHRSFSVLSRDEGDSTPMIQKRTATCASSQPLTSKWWCSGARLNTRCSRAYSSPYLSLAILEHEPLENHREHFRRRTLLRRAEAGTPT